MTEDKKYLLFNILDDRELEIAVFSKQEELKKVVIEPPEQISETLWKTLAVWFPKDTSISVSGIAFKQKRNKGTYSTVRTVLSIINTLGIVENIPIVQATANDSRELIIKKFNSESIYELTANYTL